MIYRILIVGLGSIGCKHLEIARDLFPEADIRLLRSKNNSCPKEANGVFILLQEAINFCPDIVVIANPASQHINIANSFAESGAHLLIEKPLSDKSSDIQPLLEIYEQKNKVLMVGYNLKFLNSLREFKSLLSANIIGKVLSVHCDVGQYLPSWRPDSDYKTTVSANKELGGGVLLELSHEIDYLRWIFGEISWVKATLTKLSSFEIDVEDTAFLTLGNNNDSLIISLNLDFLRHDKTRQCIAIGEKGTLRWNGITGVVDIFLEGSKKWEILFSSDLISDNSYVKEWNHFIECIEKNIKPINSGYDGLKVLEIIEAAKISSDLNSKVFLEHI